MQPLYLARIEDRRARRCREGRLRGRPSRRALPTPDSLLRLGLSAQTKVLDLKPRVSCRGGGDRVRNQKLPHSVW
jgi:hypothetical protein